MIKLSHVWKRYKLDGEDFIALSDISLAIKQGEFVSILGPSGSGKSTLMHIIGLLDNPTSGNIQILDQDVSKLSDDQLSKFRSEYVGFVFQQFNLVNKLTVVENILLPTIYSVKKQTISADKRANQLMERFGITSKVNSYPNKLSGGQQQRVAIARALINNPKLILADEPTGNLDTKTGETILQLLKDLNTHDKVTVVIVTHDEKIAHLTQRQIKIVDGKILQK